MQLEPKHCNLKRWATRCICFIKTVSRCELTMLKTTYMSRPHLNGRGHPLALQRGLLQGLSSACRGR